MLMIPIGSTQIYIPITPIPQPLTLPPSPPSPAGLCRRPDPSGPDESHTVGPLCEQPLQCVLFTRRFQQVQADASKLLEIKDRFIMCF